MKTVGMDLKASVPFLCGQHPGSVGLDQDAETGLGDDLVKIGANERHFRLCKGSFDQGPDSSILLWPVAFSEIAHLDNATLAPSGVRTFHHVWLLG